MKGLILAALVGFVLAFTLALPFTEDEIKAYNTELKAIGNDITQRYVASMLTWTGKRKTQSKTKNIYDWYLVMTPILVQFLYILKL